MGPPLLWRFVLLASPTSRPRGLEAQRVRCFSYPKVAPHQRIHVFRSVCARVSCFSRLLGRCALGTRCKAGMLHYGRDMRSVGEFHTTRGYDIQQDESRSMPSSGSEFSAYLGKFQRNLSSLYSTTARRDVHCWIAGSDAEVQCSHVSSARFVSHDPYGVASSCSFS